MKDVCAFGDSDYELRFADLAHAGHGYAFPCDGRGQVNLDRLSDKGRANYFFARATVGHQLAWPTVSRRMADVTH
ncbi:MAG TPA: hypothetical protein VE029_14980 [Rhizobacter sp.]|nr:hypothetical protein [Rhizobacter sp.]